MFIDLILPVSMFMSMLAWALVAKWYLYPHLLRQSFVNALLPLLFIHCFRSVGLMFLIPGVTAEVLDPRFALPAAYGDLIAAILAFISIVLLKWNVRAGTLSIWLFNIWGLLDLINAVVRGIMYVPNGSFGATYWIPGSYVPFLLITHILIFILLLKPKNRFAWITKE